MNINSINGLNNQTPSDNNDISTYPPMPAHIMDEANHVKAMLEQWKESDQLFTESLNRYNTTSPNWHA